MRHNVFRLFLHFILVLCSTVEVSAENYKSLQQLLSAPNATYQISANYDLGGKTIRIPQNCVLNFVFAGVFSASIE